MRTPHTSAPSGIRIKVTLRDGTVFIDKFRKKVRDILTFDGHTVRAGQVRSFTIYKADHAATRNRR